MIASRTMEKLDKLDKLNKKFPEALAKPAKNDDWGREQHTPLAQRDNYNTAAKPI